MRSGERRGSVPALEKDIPQKVAKPPGKEESVADGQTELGLIGKQECIVGEN